MSGHHTDKQHAYTNRDGLIRYVKIKVSHTGDQKKRDDEVRKSPQHVHGRG